MVNRKDIFRADPKTRFEKEARFLGFGFVVAIVLMIVLPIVFGLLMTEINYPMESVQ